VVAVAETFESMPDPARVLAEHGPLAEDDIARRLRDAGVADPDAVMDEVLDEIECPARQLIDDRWVWLPALLSGRVFTHRLSADEASHDALTVSADLGPITALCDHDEYQQLADGSPVRIALAGYGDELLASGTLAASGVAEGDLVGMRLTEHGLVVERVTAPAQSEVGAALAATVDADEPVYFDAAVWTVCAGDSAAFNEPLPPLHEIAEDHGLAHRGGWLAPGGFDWERWHFERGCAALAELHDLDPDDAVALYTLVKLHEQVSALIHAADADEVPDDPSTAADESATQPVVDGFPDLIGELGAALADPLLAELLVVETIGNDPEGVAALGLFAEMMEPRVPRAARVAFRWLRAVALERIGDIDEAERELLAAESMDPDWPLPLLDLARFASDRGDVERGLALLRRAEAEPDHPLMELLQRYRVEAQHDLGRNEPCWCGSGRKYKRCHLGREQLPLAERAAWLYAKAAQHALLSEFNDLLFEVTWERCRYDDDDPEALYAALNDPLVTDALLFEGGAFEDFLEIRGSLLPDDERLLAEQWLPIERSVFEVEQVRPGQRVTVRDLRTGDTHEVRERAASGQLRPGQLVCAHVLPAGDTMQFFGGVEPVAPHERDPLIDLLNTEPDAVSLVAQLSRRFAPRSDGGG
jgi:SEC-C motif